MYKINKSEIKSIIIITLGMLSMAIGLNLFLAPAEVFTTGIMGLSQEIAAGLTYFFKVGDLTPIIYWLINIPTVILGWVKLGRRFTIRTFYAVTILSIFTAIIPTDLVLVDDQILAVLAAGIFIGVGTGYSLKVGGSSGGTDIIALYVSMFKGKSFGTYNLLVNSIVIFIALAMTGDFNVAILMLVLTYIASIAIDRTHNAFEKCSLFIVTTKGEDVRKSLIENYRRGLTLFDTYGGYNKSQNTTIFMTVDQGELYNVVETIKNVDENAFVNISNTYKVVGAFEDNYKNLL